MRDSIAEQMLEFSKFELEQSRGIEIKREFSDWVATYRRWATLHDVEPVPETIFLSAFSKTPGVRKTIFRKKDPNSGRVIKNAAGSPIRGYFYTLQQPTSNPASAPIRTEPTEREDPLNAALDEIERLVSDVILGGGEAPLRCRLRRLLPAMNAELGFR